jgi:hypothetical protein
MCDTCTIKKDAQLTENIDPYRICLLLDDDRYRCDAEQQEQALPRDGQSFASYPGHFARLFLLMAEKYVILCTQVENFNDR